MNNSTQQRLKQTAQPQPPSNNSPELTQSLHQQFLKLFPHRWDWIRKDLDSKWYTVKDRPLEDDELIVHWRNPYRTIGVRFTKETRYFMLDIDYNSSLHPRHDEGAKLRCLQMDLEDIGITRTVLLRSSDSEGIHLYAFLPGVVPTFKSARLVRNHLEACGYKFKPGELEQFPNTKQYGRNGHITLYNGHRLPLQQGSCLLDKNYQPSSESGEKGLSQFMQQVESCLQGQDWELFSKLVAQTRTGNCGSEKYSPEQAKWRQTWETIIDNGFVTEGMTNCLTKTAVNHGIVFKGLTGMALIEYATDLVKAMPGYEENCNHQHEIEQRVRDWAKGSDENGFYWPLGTQPTRQGTFKQNYSHIKAPNKNQIESLKAVGRIKKALENRGELVFNSVRAFAEWISKQIKQLFGQGISLQTLYKHKELWLELIGKPENPNRNPAENPAPETLSPPGQANEKIGVTPPSAQSETKTPETPTESGVTHLAYNEGFLSGSEKQNTTSGSGTGGLRGDEQNANKTDTDLVDAIAKTRDEGEKSQRKPDLPHRKKNQQSASETLQKLSEMIARVKAKYQVSEEVEGQNSGANIPASPAREKMEAPQIEPPTPPHRKEQPELTEIELKQREIQRKSELEQLENMGVNFQDSKLKLQCLSVAHDILVNAIEAMQQQVKNKRAKGESLKDPNKWFELALARMYKPNKKSSPNQTNGSRREFKQKMSLDWCWKYSRGDLERFNDVAQHYGYSPDSIQAFLQSKQE